MAVELAKLALWLETVVPDRPLTFLDHHLRHGNSLIGTRVGRLAILPRQQGTIAETFKGDFENKLPSLLALLADIRREPSETLSQVKTKGKRYSAFTKAAEPFREVADLWCAAVTGAELDPENYRDALALVDKSLRFRKLAGEEWFQRAKAHARATACFHWELEFPEVFFGPGGAHSRSGFGAVIGNPPYEVLAEKESGQDLSALRAFIEAEPIYAPSKGGKNNLYKLFVCRALDLLAEGGRLVC